VHRWPWDCCKLGADNVIQKKEQTFIVDENLVGRRQWHQRWARRWGDVESVKRQYFLAYAVMGSLWPFLPVLLKQQGLTAAQIGYATGASNVAILFTPVLITLLADSHQDARRLLAGIFGLSGLALVALYFVTGFWPSVIFLCLYSLAYVAMSPIQDGLNFAVQRQREAGGESVIPYHQIRVWGTIGFIFPSLLLFGTLHQGAAINSVLFMAAAFSVLGLINSLRLPELEPITTPAVTDGSNRLPTAEAGRALLRPTVFIFCVGMLLALLASSAYYAFFPLYLTQVLGVQQQWLGPIYNVGVVCEIGYMLSFGWLLRRLGLKRFMVLGTLGISLRMAVLAFCPIVAVVVATQAVHGLVVVSTSVAPALYLNRHASDHYRSSIQGLYTMLIVGTSRIAGSFLSGHLAQVSLPHLFAWATVASLMATCIFAFGFHDDSGFDTE